MKLLSYCQVGQKQAAGSKTNLKNGWKDGLILERHNAYFVIKEKEKKSSNHHSYNGIKIVSGVCVLTLDASEV